MNKCTTNNKLLKQSYWYSFESVEMCWLLSHNDNHNFFHVFPLEVTYPIKRHPIQAKNNTNFSCKLWTTTWTQTPFEISKILPLNWYICMRKAAHDMSKYQCYLNPKKYFLVLQPGSKSPHVISMELLLNLGEVSDQTQETDWFCHMFLYKHYIYYLFYIYNG